jgi:alpha-L-fucosidase
MKKRFNRQRFLELSAGTSADALSVLPLVKKMKRREFLLGTGATTGAALSLSFADPAFAQVTQSTSNSQALTPTYTVPSKMDWWYAARFGMFIHFGSYSYLGHGEWAFYNENWSKANYQAQVSAPFNPTNFDAATIVSYAKQAGMKYLVITSKHHEGFAMWHSQVASFTDTTGQKRYNLYDYTAYKSDLLGALKSECANQGIQFGLYYSIMDWNHSSQTANHVNGEAYTTMASMTARTNYINDMKAHLQELITLYDPAILWFDGDWCANPSTPTLDDWWVEADGQSLYNYLIGLKPSLIVNERVKRGFGLGDYTVSESGVPSAPLSRVWEACDTMNGAWGYNASQENSYKSSASLIQELVKIVSRDGNFLLNIGPKGDGSMTDGSKKILSEMGTWMSIYGESIYGATASPYSAEPSWGFYTKTSGKLYVHVLKWPTTGTLQIPALSNTINQVYLLNAPGTPLNYAVNGGSITITVPTSAPNAVASVIVVSVSGVPTALFSGYYRLVNRNSGQVLDINGASTADGGAAIQWPSTGGWNQYWQLLPNDDASYKLVCRNSGKLFEVPGSSTTNGTPLDQWTDTASSNQWWKLVSVGGGYYTLVNDRNGLLADVQGGSTAQGTPVIQWPGNGGYNQHWSLVQVS